MTAIQQLNERGVMLMPPDEEAGCLSSTWRVSRRYSIVASEVALLALNTLFLISKIEKNDTLGESALFLLSCISILFLHYPVDTVWKATQDTRFAIKHRSLSIAALATFKGLQQASNIALTIGNFTAAAAGLSNPALQTKMYRSMILWGEITLGSGLLLTALSTYATWRVHKHFDQASAPLLRYCMDKDTLWHLIDKLQCGEEDVEQVVRDNIATQLKVTLGGKIVLTIIGDGLQAAEKYYTPNSIESAVINSSMSAVYAIWISVEKGMEYCQRSRLDRQPLLSEI